MQIPSIGMAELLIILGVLCLCAVVIIAAGLGVFFLIKREQQE